MAHSQLLVARARTVIPVLREGYNNAHIRIIARIEAPLKATKHLLSQEHRVLSEELVWQKNLRRLAALNQLRFERELAKPTD